MLSKNLFNTRKRKILGTRNGYGDALMELGKNSKNVMVLSCDLTESTRVLDFSKKYPNRFVEVGVAEQNMAGIAAGLALEGKVPFCSSYAVFNPGRNWDQIRVSVCYNNANVKIVGSHAGITVGSDGATHQALEDIAMTRVLPNMIVVVPCDYHEAKKATLAIAKEKGPAYIRLARNATPVITTKNSLFKIGKSEVLKEGTDVTVIACGPLVYEALLAARELAHEGVSIEVINNPSIKPFDTKALLKSVKKTEAVVSVEEHQVAGGLGSVVAEQLSQHYPVSQEMVGMPDSFGESGKPEELLAKYGMDSSAIIDSIYKVLKRK